jgi:uncharacterized protein (DUF3084 family)
MALFWLLLILGIALIGGLIAWLGDSVGRRVGRKHLRIFGLRPKTTGLVFAVGSGVLVALATFGTVSILARSTVDNAIKAPEMRLELEQLKRNLKAIESEYQSSKANLVKMKDQSVLEQQEFDRVRNELQLRQDELNATTALNGRLGSRIAGLETERNNLGQQITNKTTELKRLGLESQARIGVLRKELNSLENQRKESTTQIRRLNTQRNQLQQRILGLASERTALEEKVLVAQAAAEQAQTEQRNLVATVAKLEVGKVALEAQQSQLETQRNGLQTERNTLQAERTQLNASIRQLENQSDVLKNERSKLQGDIRELNQTRTSLEASVNRLETQNTTLTQQLNRAESELRVAQEALAEATSGNFIYRQGDLVSQLILESNSAETLREQLQKWLKQASQVAQTRGATRSKSVVLKPSADLDPYINLALKSKGSDLVLMRTSRSVTQTGIELPVTLEVRANEILFSNGQPIRSRELGLGNIANQRPNSSWRVAIENLLRETERDLIERGVPRENLPVGLVSTIEVNAFMTQLENFGGTVWIAVAARREITPAGPVQVYLSLMR